MYLNDLTLLVSVSSIAFQYFAFFCNLFFIISSLLLLLLLYVYCVTILNSFRLFVLFPPAVLFLYNFLLRLYYLWHVTVFLRCLVFALHDNTITKSAAISSLPTISSDQFTPSFESDFSYKTHIPTKPRLIYIQMHTDVFLGHLVQLSSISIHFFVLLNNRHLLSVRYYCSCIVICIIYIRLLDTWQYHNVHCASETSYFLPEIGKSE